MNNLLVCVLLLADLGLPRATYCRRTTRELSDDLTDRVVTPTREPIPPTPAEAGRPPQP